MNKRFWEFKALSSNVSELLLYGEIANELWWGDEVTPLQFRSELAAVVGDEICVRINSPGGNVFAANAIYAALKECAAQGKKITCKIDGVCASAATIVAMAATTISIPSNAYMMIHNPSLGMCGQFSADELTKIAAQLLVIKSGMINAYSARTGLSEEECSNLMDAEKWMTGKEAVEMKFADEILFEDPQVEPLEGVTNSLKINGVQMNVAAFANVPEALRSALNTNPNLGEGDSGMEIKNTDELKAAFPELVASIETAAREEGVQAERSRVKAIDGMAGKVTPEALSKAKYETFASAEAAALAALTSGETLNTQVLAGLANDATNANEVPGFANSGPAKDLTQKQIDAKFAADTAAAFFGKDGK